MPDQVSGKPLESRANAMSSGYHECVGVYAWRGGQGGGIAFASGPEPVGVVRIAADSRICCEVAIQLAG